MIVVLGVGLMVAHAAASLQTAGRIAYETRCAACHGRDLAGGANAPTLRGVGAADLDFWMMTGRMPAAVPWIQVEHRRAQLPQPEIRSIEAYVTSIAPGGPPIPEVATGGNLARGRTLFAQNCQPCHGIGGIGASIGGIAWAPNLHAASSTQVAEAIRVGPGNMPRFGAAQIDRAALDDLATYVSSLDEIAATPAVPLGSSGPVPEGLFGWLGAGVLALAAYAFSRPSKSVRTEPRLSKGES